MRINYSEDECNVIIAALDSIRKELDRLYYNKNQKEMHSPFDNTSESYENCTFQVHAYYWGDDEELIHRPNFKYGNLKVYWYKNCGRGTYAVVEGKPLTIEDIEEMIKECFKALRKDFGEE